MKIFRFAIVSILAALVASTTAPASAPTQARRMLAIRAAQVDGYHRLAELAMEAHLAADRTVRSALPPAGDAEIALRLYLRSARMVGDTRVYSDGVAEADIEIPLDGVVQKILQLCPPPTGRTWLLEDLRGQAVDGSLRVGGGGRVPQDVPPEVVARLESSPPDELAEMFPAGWERVTVEGRVEAVRRARVRAYEAMAALVRGLRVGSTWTADDLVAGSPAAETLLDQFLRSLPVAGPPRMMPDGIAEVEVAVPVRELIQTLKDIRAMAPSDSRWTEEQVDQLSVQLKAERLVVTGRGMPPPDQVLPAEALTELPGAPLPDWAAGVLEARGTARVPEDIDDPAEARLLAARSAKARAVADLEKQVDAVVLEDGRTVRDRAAKEEAFRRDVATLLASAKTVRYQPSADGKRWEADLRLPLMRLWGFSRTHRP